MSYVSKRYRTSAYDVVYDMSIHWRQDGRCGGGGDLTKQSVQAFLARMLEASEARSSVILDVLEGLKENEVTWTDSTRDQRAACTVHASARARARAVRMRAERVPASNPYVCPVENVLGRVPLIPCFLRGNTNNTIPYSLRYEVPDSAAADSRHDSGTESRLFEVNVWMWNYGRAFPRKISVADAGAMRRKCVQDSRRRGAETLKRRSEASAVRPAE